MNKSILREIKGSFSRWIAILAIVTLGVGFLTGLKVCKPAFVLTGDTFLNEYNFFDYQLISTLGLEDEDVDSIKALDNIKEAEGTYSCDALITVEGDQSEKVVKFHTISQKINTLQLKSGKLPTKDYEVVGDCRHFSSDDIGKTVTISSSNKKETKELFKKKEYTLVGLVESPVYINFERGSTSLGDGTVFAYIYALPKAFDSEVYTEIYLTLENGGYLYSKEYKDNAKAMEKTLENTLDDCAERRYNKIVDDANAELAKAEEKLADGEKKLKDNQIKVTDGEKELKDNEKKLKDAKAEYEKGLKDYEENYKTTYDQLSELEASLPALVGTPVYQQYLAQYEQGKAAADAQFEQALKELNEAKDKISDGEKELRSGKKKIADAKVELSKARAKLSDARKELSDARDKIDDIEHPSTYVLSRETNIGYACFENDIGIIDSIAKVFPIFFFLVAALVCMTTMTRMIDDQRTQIGVLKALGYNNRAILWKYIFYSGSASILGGIIGFVCGIYLFPAVFWQAYSMMYDFSDIIFVVDIPLGILAILVALICSVGTTIYSCYHELKNVPSQLIRPKAPALGKRILLERISFIWNRLKFLHKVCLRNIFRYKKRFFMMVLGICGCTALLVTAMGISDSIKNVVTDQYDLIFHNDYTITFDRDMSQKHQQAFEADNEEIIEDILYVKAEAVDVHVNEQIKSVNLVAISKEDVPSVGRFIDLHDVDGNTLEFPSDGQCIINQKLAKNMGLSVGKKITFYNSDRKELVLEISGLCENYVNNYVYMTSQSYSDQWDNFELNSAFAIGKGLHQDSSQDSSSSSSDTNFASSREQGAKLLNHKYVSQISITDDFRERIGNMMESLDYVIILIILCAGALAFIVLYNLTNINITERIREIATIKVLGFYPNETNAYVFRENLVLTAISALVGLPLGKLLHGFVIEQINVDLLSFNLQIAPISYIVAVLLTFAFTIIVNLAMNVRLKNVSMTESLKSIE